jgi:2-succinyl-5-enolpyruvyl-6-hydroxy-3-cyclohexene-1-carboxylate synthase
MSNRNVLWTDVFVDELARAGLKAVCIAPGSRSTPLTLAFARHGGIRIYTHLDERSAGFFALGLALASDEPVALVCTSGTAAANFFPAIVEAHMSRVPLLVITADRPPELRFSGANQTIDQIKMYGDYALWSVDAPLPEANPAALTIRSLRTLANRAYAKANGIHKGVVHINMPFRKPLEPIPVAGDAVEIPKGAEARADDGTLQYQPWTYFSPPLIDLSFPEPQEPASWLEGVILQNGKGLIICGPHCPGDPFNAYVKCFAQKVGYPILADAVSNVRFDNGYAMAGEGFENIAGGYDTFLSPRPGLFDNPEVILRFGSLPTSQALNSYLSKVQPRYDIQIAHSGEWSDDNHSTSIYIQAFEAFFCRELEERFQREKAAIDASWLSHFRAVEQMNWQVIDREIKAGTYFDGAAVYDVVDLIPPDSTLFVGNSLPVRLLDQFGKPQDKRIYVYANRGASGIDGNISSALGAGAARPDKPLVAIVGDITFYHDMNGLLAVHRNGVPITIVLLNNDGGGIFHRLPIKDFDPAFTDLFVMPHGLQFEHAAKMYGLEYVRADDREAFRQAFSESVDNRLSRVIEVRTDVHHDLKRRQDIMDAVQQRIAELNL